MVDVFVVLVLVRGFLLIIVGTLLQRVAGQQYVTDILESKLLKAELKLFPCPLSKEQEKVDA